MLNNNLKALIVYMQSSYINQNAEYTSLVCWACSNSIYRLYASVYLCKTTTVSSSSTLKSCHWHQWRWKKSLCLSSWFIRAFAVEIGHWFRRLKCFGVSFICHGNHFDQTFNHIGITLLSESDVVQARWAHNSIIQEGIESLPAFALTLENVLSAYCVQHEKSRGH